MNLLSCKLLNISVHVISKMRNKFAILWKISIRTQFLSTLLVFRLTGENIKCLSENDLTFDLLVLFGRSRRSSDVHEHSIRSLEA